jgi:hypothetical protein
MKPVIASTAAIVSGLVMWIGCGKNRNDSTAITSLIEQSWKEFFDIFPTGDVAIIRPGKSVAIRRGEAPASDLKAYEALQQANVLRINSNIDLTRGFGGWDAWTDLPQRGVTHKLNVSVNAGFADHYTCPERIKKLNTKAICVLTGSGRIEEVVRSEHFQAGTEELWLLMGNHKWKWSDVERLIRQARGEEVDENRKFMAIAKYDHFGKKWTLDLVDYAPRTAAFPDQERFDRALVMAQHQSSSER